MESGQSSVAERDAEATGEGTPRVLIVSEHASAKFGGEACLPLHYFRILRRRGVEAWLVVHERTRPELVELLPGEVDRMHFIPDTRVNVMAWKLGRFLPDRIGAMTFGWASRLDTQAAARRLVRRLVAEHGVDVVHQPIPVSPREPSLMHGVGAAVVIGPMNGGMSYPPAFEKQSGKLAAVGAVVGMGRKASGR